MSFDDFFTQRIKRGLVRRLNNLKIAAMSRQVAQRAPEPNGQPVAFFKASTGIDDLSWNSGFHMLASWALRLQGVPVVYFACNAGMSHCVLGTNREEVHRQPPCKSCIYQSRTLYTAVPSAASSNLEARVGASGVHWFTFDREAQLEQALQSLSLHDLTQFQWALRTSVHASTNYAASPGKSPLGSLRSSRGHEAEFDVPLGQLCLPGLRWILRRHNLDDDEDTRFLLREYMLSAWNVAQKFARFLDETDPRAVVVFNGQFFPEAAARFVAQRRGLRVITHEVGLQPASAFFTEGDATAYPMTIPDDFELNAAQNSRLDDYLQKRFRGQFSMAGIEFWPTMRGLDASFLKRAARFQQVVPVFTNVIFDTSQPHANAVFADMFAWLEMVLDAVKAHPDTMFVIRAHPDETRTRKESRETVQGWAGANGVEKLPNVVFVAPTEYLSSYELIQRSKFVMVYNSTIGLEASIMGKPVLCGGRARFTQYPTVFFPQSADQQTSKMVEFLAAETIDVPPEFMRNARRFLYYQLFKTSLPFGDYLVPSVRKTQTRLKSFGLERLAHSSTVGVISKGINNNQEFLIDD